MRVRRGVNLTGARQAGISKETAQNYVEALRTLFLFDRIPAYAKSDYDMIGKRPKWMATDAALMARPLWRTRLAPEIVDRNRRNAETVPVPSTRITSFQLFRNASQRMTCVAEIKRKNAAPTGIIT